MSRLTPQGPLKFKCMYEHCSSISLDNHAVCRLHLNFELLLVSLAGFTAVAALIYFLSRFH